MGPRYKMMMGDLLDWSERDGQTGTVADVKVIKSGTRIDVEIQHSEQANGATHMLTYAALVLNVTQAAIELGAKNGTSRDDVLILLGFKEG